jgi:OOP family OmpA-OmpF porin
LFVSILGAALAAPALIGCTASIKAGGAANAGEQQPPPPPPPPPPAAKKPAPPPKAAPPPKTVSKVTQKGDTIKLPGNIVFDTGKATLKAGSGSEVVLQQLKEFLDQNPQITLLRVEGHTDNVGKPADNMELSGQRALTIEKWLVAHGVKADRVLAVGFGETKPIADNSTDAGKAQNRRTEFHIAKLGGKKYLGMNPTGGGKVFK